MLDHRYIFTRTVFVSTVSLLANEEQCNLGGNTVGERAQLRKHCHESGCIGVILYQLSKDLHLTPSELSETWFVGSVCGFMKPPNFICCMASNIQFF